MVLLVHLDCDFKGLICFCYGCNSLRCFDSLMNTFSEGLVLAEKSGLDPHTLLDVLVRQCLPVSSCQL